MIVRFLECQQGSIKFLYGARVYEWYDGSHDKTVKTQVTGMNE